MSSPKRPVLVMKGRASLELVRAGTGSAHTGVVLTTAEGERMVLVRLGGNPFDDAETHALAGHVIEVSGYRVGNELRYLESRVLK